MIWVFLSTVEKTESGKPVINKDECYISKCLRLCSERIINHCYIWLIKQGMKLLICSQTEKKIWEKAHLTSNLLRIELKNSKNLKLMKFKYIKF